MGSRQRHAVRRGVVAQRAGQIVAELEIVGGDPRVLLAEVFGQNAADFAIADKADAPAIGIGGCGGHFETVSRSDLAAVSYRSSDAAKRNPGRVFAAPRVSRRLSPLLLRNSGPVDYLLPLVDVGF